MGGFSKKDVGRIGASVRDFERNRGGAGNGASGLASNDGFEVFVLIDPLYENGRAKAVPNGHRIGDNTWHASEQETLIRGWKCTGRKWAPGKEGLCFSIGGRWFWMIPEDCGEEMAEGDDALAATQETDYDTEELT